MAQATRFTFLMPEGYQYYGQCIEVADIASHRRAAHAFAVGTTTELLFESDPKLSGDIDYTTAIRIVGTFKGRFTAKKKYLGYLPEEFARKLLKNNLLAEVVPQLRRVFITDLKEVHVEFDLVGPTASFRIYQQS